MKKVLFAITFGAIIVVGCKKEQGAPQHPVLQTVSLRASGEAFDGVNLDGTTKGTMDTDGTFRWAAGDMIGVRLYKGAAYLGSDPVSDYDAWDSEFLLNDASAGNPSGVFTCTTSIDEEVHWGYAAYYPKFSNSINNIDGKVYFELKKTYDNYTSGSCLMPMVANLNDPDKGGVNGRPGDMKLKHVGAGVRVTLKDVPVEANQASLTVTGKNIVNGTGNTARYGVNPANAGTDFISATDGTENTVYLKFATASEKRDITFIFPLPTVDLSGGIELKLYYNDGTDEHKEFWRRKASTLPALTRGQLLDMPSLTVPVDPDGAA